MRIVRINILMSFLGVFCFTVTGLTYGQRLMAGKMSEDRIKSRLWININNGKGGFKQMAIAYVPGATTGHDRLFDSQVFSSSDVIIYTINGDYKYSVEGRPYTILDKNETIPMGYVAEADEEYQISIDRFDGNFDKKEIFINDKEKDSIHNLSEQAYVFESLKGTNDVRFELMIRDKQTLGVADYNSTNFSVIAGVDKLTIVSGSEKINNVEIISVLGTTLWDEKYNSATTIEINGIVSKRQVLIVRVLLENGFYKAKKVLF